MSPMSDTKKKRRKPRLSFQVEPLDVQAIKAVAEQFPGVSESFLLRAAIRVGLQEIVKDRALLAIEPVSPKAFKPKRR